MTKKIETDLTIRGNLTITGSVAETLFTGAVHISTGGVTGPTSGLNVYSTLYTGGASGTTQAMASFYSVESYAKGVGAGIILGGSYTGSVKYEFTEIAGVKATSTSGSKRGNLVIKTTNSAGVLGERVRVGSDGGITIGGTAAGSLFDSPYFGSVALNGSYGGAIDFLADGTDIGILYGTKLAAFGNYPEIKLVMYTGVPTGAVFSIQNDNGDYGMQWSPDTLQTVFGASGATGTSSALVAVTSTTKGFLPPRMTTTERDAISSAADGLIVYNTTTNKLNVYSAGAWGPVNGGVLYQNTADATTTTGTGEQTLFTYTLPAASLVNDGDIAEVIFHISVTSAAVTKQLQFYVGSVVAYTYTVASGTGTEALVKLLIQRQGATTSRVSVSFTAYGAFGVLLGSPVSINTSSITWSSSQDIKATVIHNSSSAGATTGRICQIRKSPV